MYPILYKKTATGAIQTWQMQIQNNQHCVISGQEGGKKVTSSWTTCTPKNVGRANETTAEEQAMLEVKAKYKKKLDGEYYNDILKANTPKIFKPMLAHKYKGGLTFPVHTQPKLDGIRAIVTKDGIKSRTGKVITSCPHILEALVSTFEEHPDLILDGELYHHNLKEDFNKLVSVIRKDKPSEQARALVQYHIYDMPSSSDNFVRRSLILTGILFWASLEPSIEIVPTCKSVNQQALDSANEKYAAQGYEGQIIRLDKPYQNKRSKFLLKRKEFADHEYKIVGIAEGKGNWAGKAKRITCQLPDGREFGATLKGTQKYCAEVLANSEKYIGKQATVKHFRETPGGIPRFGIVKSLHLKERL